MNITQDTKCIYIISAPEVNRVKIGVSNNPHKRLVDIRVASSVAVYLSYYTKPVYNYRKLEHRMHTMFKHKHFNGEWFNCSVNEVKDKLIGLYQTYKIDDILSDYESLNKNATKVAFNYGVTKQAVIKYLKYKCHYKDESYITVPPVIDTHKIEPKIKDDGLLSKSAIQLMVERNDARIKAKRNK